MNHYKRVIIAWNDTPTEEIQTTVCIGEWDGNEDDQVFFYFDTLEQYKQAFTPYKNDEFRIVKEII